MRKIGELKGKPIIEGNPNEIKKNQLHYKESDGGITLSERKGDNTLSSVTSGSGSGEGENNIVYYKIDNNLPDNIIQLIPTISSVVVLNSAIIKQLDDDIDIKNVLLTHMLNRDGESSFYDTFSNNNIIAFSYINQDSYVASYSISGVTKLKGTLFDRIAAMMNNDVEIIIQAFGPYIKEITKEEYESMITYKPE